MIDQPLGGVSGQATEIDIAAKRILRIKDKMNGILAELTKKEKSVIVNDTERDLFMFADEALEYGLIDEIISQKSLFDSFNK